MNRAKYRRDQKRSLLLAMIVACMILLPQKVHAITVNDSPKKSSVKFEYIGNKGAPKTSLELATAAKPAEQKEVSISDKVWNEDPLRQYIYEQCQEKNVPVSIAEAVIEKESGWQEDAENGNCKGLMQIYVPSHKTRMKNLGVTDIMDPFQNVTVGIDILGELYDKYEIPELVLMHYQMKPETADRMWKQGLVSKYAKKVIARAEEIEQEYAQKGASDE